MIGYILIAAAVVLICAWLFAIAPGDDAGMEKFRDVRYAHRGLHGDIGGDGYAAENSMTAFKRAVDHGFGIELDVRITKDNELVVFHDGTLDRITGVSGKVCDFTLEELKKLSLSGTEDTIPTLSEVLTLVDGKIPLLVEIKEDGAGSAAAEKTAEVLSGYSGDFIVESFSPIALAAIKRLLPTALRGFLADKHTKNKDHRSIQYRVTQRFLLNILARPAFIAMNHKRPNMFPLPVIKAVFKTPVIAWTVRSKEEELQAYKNGFSGVIFENYIPE